VKGEDLIIRVNGPGRIRITNIERTLAAYKPASADSSSALAASIVLRIKGDIAAAKLKLPVLAPPAEANIVLPVAIEVPMAGLGSLKIPRAFQSALAEKLAELVFSRHESASPKTLQFYLTGPLELWQKEVVRQSIARLGFVRMGSVVGFKGLVFTLVEAKGQREIERQGNQVTLPIENPEGDAAGSLVEVLHEAMAIARVMGNGNYLTENSAGHYTINDAEARQDSALHDIAQYHRDFMANPQGEDPKQVLDVSDLYGMMREMPTASSRFAGFAFRLPALKKIKELLTTTAALIRSVTAAA
jgi:hypothetical protein